MTRTLLVLFSGVMLAGCQAIATVVGGGIGPVVERAQERGVSQTFAQPLAPAREALVQALEHLGFDVRSLETTEEGEVLRALGIDREIEVRLVPVAASATRVTAEVRAGFLVRDRATAEEILAQAGRRLESAAAVGG
ncbi:MAG TPA: hypothetical protein VM489_16380 [Burkholderiales bacterium]|nr:hypothetical protein [Burkholderiales bacterium]